MPNTTQTATTSPTIAAIDRMIEIAEQEAKSLAGQEGDRGGLVPGTRKGAPGSPTVSDQLEELDAVVSKLTSIRTWLTDDPRLVPIVDDYIGQQVRATAMRQTRQNLLQNSVFAVVGVVLGWLAGLLGSPQSVLHIFGH